MSLAIKKDFGQTSRDKRPDLTSLVYGKVPPQAPELEEAVIGACMLEKETFEQVREIIYSADCLYADAHQKIYSCMLDLYNSGTQIDLLTIQDRLRKTNNLELVGGSHYLSRLTQSVLSSAHAKTHALIVMEKFMQREVIRICGKAISEAYEDSADVFELMEEVETQIKAIGEGVLGGTDVPVGVTYQQLLETTAKQRESKTEVIGVPTGFDELDRITMGGQPGDLIILAARPANGKTAVAVNIAEKSKVPTLIFSLETVNMPLVRRIAAAKLDIPLKDIRRGCMDIDQFDKMKGAIAMFNKMPIRIDSKSRTLDKISKAIRRWVKAERKKDPNTLLQVLLDYIQLMEISGSKSNREQEISKISRGLKELASELEIPIIALAQLNREVEKRGNKKPMLMDLRESGALEQDATSVWFIWWEETNEKDAMGEFIKRSYIVVAKNREGECGDVELKFNADVQRWMNLEENDHAVMPASVRHKGDSDRRANAADEDNPF